MKKLFLTGALLAALMALPLAAIGSAQEEPSSTEETQAEKTQTEKLGSSYGLVLSISNNKIVIKEYDEEIEEYVEVAYTISAETKLGKTTKEIQSNDDIEINFKDVKGEKVALEINKEAWDIEKDLELKESKDEAKPQS